MRRLRDIVTTAVYEEKQREILHRIIFWFGVPSVALAALPGLWACVPGRSLSELPRAFLEISFLLGITAVLISEVCMFVCIAGFTIASRHLRRCALAAETEPSLGLLLTDGVFVSGQSDEGKAIKHAVLQRLNCTDRPPDEHLSLMQLANLVSLFEAASTCERENILALVATSGTRSILGTLRALRWRHRNDPAMAARMDQYMNQIANNEEPTWSSTLLRGSKPPEHELLLPVSPGQDSERSSELLRPLEMELHRPTERTESLSKSADSDSQTGPMPSFQRARKSGRRPN